jgi:hypothetical protein
MSVARLPRQRLIDGTYHADGERVGGLLPLAHETPPVPSGTRARIADYRELLIWTNYAECIISANRHARRLLPHCPRARDDKAAARSQAAGSPRYSGLFIFGLRRTGSTTFLRQDLIPALETAEGPLRRHGRAARPLRGPLVQVARLWNNRLK